MKSFSMNKLLLALATAGLMAGCSTTKLDTDVPVESRTPGAVAPSAASTSSNPAPESQVASVDLAAAEKSALSGLPRTVYFDYDSFVVKDEFRNVIDANAKALAANTRRRVSIEGHTDARGGSEYNLALGQKRAEAVAKSLSLIGASESQMEAVSFGKERPAEVGETEAAYAKNRRVEFNYR